MSDDIDYKCILEFDDQSPAFTLGFQAGGIWERMKTGEGFIDVFSGENLELIQRMPARQNGETRYVFDIQEMKDGWYKLIATPQWKPKP